MAKIPTNLPEVGDRCKLRGRNFKGILKKLNKLNWAWVDWNGHEHGPVVCHLYELEKIDG
jgi:hypothetical protein